MLWASSFAILLPLLAHATPLVEVTTVAPSVRVDARYNSDFNFLGRRVEGYSASKCLLTKEAAAAVAEAQKYVEPYGLSLLVLDCYRPQRAVTEFVNWVKGAGPEGKKSHFYPDEDRAKLIEHGYIDAHSGHSRGSTLDLTLVSATAPAGLHREAVGDCRHPDLAGTGQLDMGTGFDCFSELAHTANSKVGEAAQRNRLLLKAVMEKAGFVNYPKEWWHFSLKNEPYKDTYFDSPVN